PWMLLGYALVPYTGILQMAAWTGVYGLSFWAVAVNAALAIGILRRPSPSLAWIGAGVAAIAFSWMLPVLGETPGTGKSIPVHIIQTNIPLDQPWQKPGSDRLLDELESLSIHKDATTGLIVWPETPAPFYLAEDPAFRARAAHIAQASGSYFLLGY